MSNVLAKIEQIQTLIDEIRAELNPDPVTVVTNASELHAALTAGGKFLVQDGEYLGNFVASKPCSFAATPGVNIRALDPLRPTFEIQASDVWMTGGTIHGGAPDRECFLVGSHTETDAAKQPQRVKIVGTILQAGPNGGRRGFSLHGSDITLSFCQVYGFWFRGQDSQGIWINNGAGPYLVEDCYIEGSGEGLMVGGSSLPIGQNPQGITIRRNTFVKPQSWRQLTGSVKNCLELKAGVGVLIEDNLFDGCWRDAQAGSPIVFSPRNQDNNAPFIQVDRVTFRRNLVQNCPDGFGVNILGTDNLAPSQASRSIVLEDNTFADGWGGVQVGDAQALSLDMRRNAFLGCRNTFLKFYGPALTALTYEQNVARSGDYGIWSDDGKLVGEQSLNASVGILTFAGNVIEQSDQRNLKYPAGTRVVPFGQLAGLIDAKGTMLDGSAGPQG